MRTMLMVLMVVVLKMLVVRWPNHEAKDNDQDDDQENEASVIRQAAAPLAHLEGNHALKLVPCTPFQSFSSNYL